ncbi:MAG: hypothetical protein AB7H90_18905 [Alphaproteobacteria bacterium]
MASAPWSVLVLLAAFFFPAFVPVAAHALSSQGLIAIGKWNAMDACAIEAQRAFPDFTAEAHAKRDAKLKDCLARQNLPPRQAPPPSR